MTVTHSSVKSKLVSTSSNNTTVIASDKGKSFLRKYWEKVRDILNRQSELIFYQHRTHSGDIVWIAYDPYMDKKYQFESEEMARIWIEQEYY